MESETTTGLASQGGHWYQGDGSPCYEIRGANGRMRPVTLRDARKLQLYPSVTTIQGVIAKPALELWKVRQGILAALTLPRFPGELDEDFAARALEDSKQQARKAALLGSAIHEAIEMRMTGRLYDLTYALHVVGVLAWLEETFPGVEWQAERSFACDMGYGGKVDLYCRRPPIVLDFKSKDFDSESKVIGYDEQGIQLAAYAHGLGLLLEQIPQRWNVFVSTRVPGLLVPCQWEPEGYARHLDMFRHTLAYWQADKGYAPVRDVAA